MTLITDLALEGGKALIGGIAGREIAEWQDKRQLEQQRKLQALQIEGNRELMGYGQSLALDTWRKTNYPAQVEQLKKAGLNVGLMYNGQGAGGQAHAGTSQGVNGATAPGGSGEIGMGLQLAMQTAMTKAQIQNIEADTALKNKQAGKTGAEESEVFTRMENIVADTQNKEAQTLLTNTMQELKDLELSRERQTFAQYVEAIDASLAKMTAEAQKAGEEAKIAAEKFRAEVELMKIQKRATDAGIKLTQAETTKIQEATNLIRQDIRMKAKENANFWENWNLQERQTYVSEQLQKIAKQRADFDTSDANKLRQYTGVITDLLGISKGLPTKSIDWSKEF